MLPPACSSWIFGSGRGPRFKSWQAHHYSRSSEGCHSQAGRAPCPLGPQWGRTPSRRSSPRTSGAGAPGPRSITRAPLVVAASGPAQVMVGLMPATLPLTTCAQPCRRWGAQGADALPRPTDGPGAQPACPGRPGGRTWPAARAAPRRRPGPARRRRWPSPACAGSAPALARADAPSRSRIWQGGQTQAFLAVRLSVAPTRSTKSPGADTADADAERADTDTGRRTPGHPDTGRADIARADTGRSHRTPDTGRVDADRECGQGDQGHDRHPDSWPPRRADRPLDAEPCSHGQRTRRSATRRLGGEATCRRARLPTAQGSCSVASPAAKQRLGALLSVGESDGAGGGQ